MIIMVDCSDRYREDASDSMERVKPSPRARYVVCSIWSYLYLTHRNKYKNITRVF